MMKVRSILFMTMLTLAQVAPARCEGTGGDATALVVQSNSTVSYRTYEIPYFVAQVSKINMGPLDREERLYVMPLVDIVRDIDGRPVVMMNSPETGGRLVLNGIRYETPEELALAVEDGIHLFPRESVLPTILPSVVHRRKLNSAMICQVSILNTRFLKGIPVDTLQDP